MISNVHAFSENTTDSPQPVGLRVTWKILLLFATIMSRNIYRKIKQNCFSKKRTTKVTKKTAMHTTWERIITCFSLYSQIIENCFHRSCVYAEQIRSSRLVCVQNGTVCRLNTNHLSSAVLLALNTHVIWIFSWLLSKIEQNSPPPSSNRRIFETFS